MEFTPEQIETIERLAGMQYTIRQIAIYFDINPDHLYQEYNDKESEFAYRFDRGRLLVAADVDMKLIDDARSGNLTAAAMYKKSLQKQELDNLKHELFGI